MKSTGCHIRGNIKIYYSTNNIHEKISRLQFRLREMQFFGNTMQKKGNWVQKRVTNWHSDWLINKGTHWEPIKTAIWMAQNFDPLWTSFEQKPQWLAFVAHLLFRPKQLSRSRKTALKTKTLSDWKKWCVDKEITDEIENYAPAELKHFARAFLHRSKRKKGEYYEPESLKVTIDT